MAKTTKKCHGTRRLYREAKPTQGNQGEEITPHYITEAVIDGKLNHLSRHLFHVKVSPTYQ